MPRKYLPQEFVDDPKRFAADDVRYVLLEDEPQYREQLEEAAETKALTRMAAEVLDLDPKPKGWEKQGTIARRIGVAETTYTKWKTGANPMPPARRKQLRGLFNGAAQHQVDAEIDAEKARARREAGGFHDDLPEPRARGWVSGLVTSRGLGRQVFVMNTTPLPSLIPPDPDDSDEEEDEGYEPAPQPPKVQAVLDDVQRAATAERATLFGPSDRPVEVTLERAGASSDPHGWDMISIGCCDPDPAEAGFLYIDLSDRWHDQVKAHHLGDFSMIGDRFVLAVLGSHDDLGPTLVTALRAIPMTLDPGDVGDWTWGAAEANVVYGDGQAVRLEWVEPDPARAAVIIGQRVKERLPVDRMGLHEAMGYTRGPWWKADKEPSRVEKMVRGWREQGLI